MIYEPDPMSVIEGGPNESEPSRQTRRLARVTEVFHTVNYYTDEINRFTDDGFRGWWHAYMAYRAAPLGSADAPLVTSVFYNFAPRMIERAVPGVWEIMAPGAVLARRDGLVRTALDRIYAAGDHDDAIAEAAELATAAVQGLDIAARPLAAALTGLAWPETPAMRLWHACTIMREHRGDSHNIALAAAEVGGLESHLLMAAAGHGNQPTIKGIRGWTEDEWAEAMARMQARGLIGSDGAYTAEGDRFRADIESHTDRLSAGPRENLGPDGSDRLFALMVDLTDFLKQNGEVAGVWPPPATLRS
jgi:hypothetical protein